MVFSCVTFMQHGVRGPLKQWTMGYRSVKVRDGRWVYWRFTLITE
jgi:hypothetical protein